MHNERLCKCQSEQISPPKLRLLSSDDVIKALLRSNKRFIFCYRDDKPFAPHMCTAGKFKLKCAGRMVSRFGKVKGWKLLILAQFLPSGQLGPGQQRNLCSLSHHAATTARAAAEPQNKGTFGAELRPKTCPASPVLALAVPHLRTANQKKSDRCEQPWLLRSNRSNADHRGCQK